MVSVVAANKPCFNSHPGIMIVQRAQMARKRSGGAGSFNSHPGIMIVQRLSIVRPPLVVFTFQFPSGNYDRSKLPNETERRKHESFNSHPGIMIVQRIDTRTDTGKYGKVSIPIREL